MGNNKRRKLGTSKRKEKQGCGKILVNIIDFSSALEFSKLCLMIEAKIITLSNVVLKANYYNSCNVSLKIVLRLATLFFQGKIFHFSPQEVNIEAS